VKTTTGKHEYSGILQVGKLTKSVLAVDLDTCIILLVTLLNQFRKSGEVRTKTSATNTFLAVPACDILPPSLVILGCDQFVQNRI
jgi:hypothetical protein